MRLTPPAVPVERMRNEPLRVSIMLASGVPGRARRLPVRRERRDRVALVGVRDRLGGAVARLPEVVVERQLVLVVVQAGLGGGVGGLAVLRLARARQVARRGRDRGDREQAADGQSDDHDDEREALFVAGGGHEQDRRIRVVVVDGAHGDRVLERGGPRRARRRAGRARHEGDVDARDALEVGRREGRGRQLLDLTAAGVRLVGPVGEDRLGGLGGHVGEQDGRRRRAGEDAVGLVAHALDHGLGDPAQRRVEGDRAPVGAAVGGEVGGEGDRVAVARTTGTAPSTHTCERSARVISSSARRPRWLASVRPVTCIDRVVVVSMRANAASRVNMPMIIATSSSVSEKPSWERRRVMAG